jgi:short-chain fatty acids transporter
MSTQAHEQKQTFMERLGGALADWSERWFPDAYVFASMAVVIVCIGALCMGRSPLEISVDFGKSFWSLVPFTMQMAFVVIGGYILAVSPPVKKLIVYLAKFPQGPKSAVAYVGFMAMLASLLSWGFSMIFAGMLMKEITRRMRVDYRAMGAAGYLGLGSIWALGFSSSAALLMATKSSIPPALFNISGHIPLQLTLFTWQNLVMIIVLLLLSTWICYASAPTGDKIRTLEDAGIQQADDVIATEDKATRPGDIPEVYPVLSLFVGALIIVYLGYTFYTKGGLAALDLNVYNLIFLGVAMIFHKTPRAFLKAVNKSVPMAGGVLIQFPLYAGIFGVLMGSGLNEVMAHFFVAISTPDTLPIVGGLYSAILGLFLPSGGGKWVVEAPYLLEAANQLKVNLAWMVQVYNAAEALPNFINPFWMLPLLGLTGIRARDLAGYSILQLIYHTPVVLFMLWILGLTMPYLAPILN